MEWTSSTGSCIIVVINMLIMFKDNGARVQGAAGVQHGAILQDMAAVLFLIFGGRVLARRRC
jgi:hypothetical protein